METKTVDSPIDLKKFYKSEMGADVKFLLRRKVCDSEATVSAHKIILAASSSVFERMFFGDLKEDDTVPIVDVSYEGFCEFLQFFYKTKIDLTTDNIIEVVKLADKYDMKEQRLICEQFIKETTKPELMISYYEGALLFNCSKELIDELKTDLCKDIRTIINSTSFADCSRTILERVLQMNEINCLEMDVFTAAIQWATAACDRMNLDASAENIRAQLGECFTLIRFPLMSSIELLSCYEKYPNLLEHKEFCDIMQCIMNKRPLTYAKHFSVVPRMSFDISVRLLDIDDSLNLNIIESHLCKISTGGIIEIKGSTIALTCYDIVLPTNIFVAPSCMLFVDVLLRPTAPYFDTTKRERVKLNKTVKTQSNQVFQVWRYHLENPFMLEAGKQYVFLIKLQNVAYGTIDLPGIKDVNVKNADIEIRYRTNHNMSVSQMYFISKP